MTTTTSSRSMWQLFIGIIDKPVVTFKAIAERPRWLAPLVVIILAFILLTVVQLPHSMELAQQQMEAQLASMPEEQAAAARPMMERGQSMPVMLATTLGFGLVVWLLGLVVEATFLYFTALVAGSDDMRFGSVFGMCSWASLPFAVGYLVQAGYIAVANRMIQYPGLSGLVATGNLLQDARDPLFIVLGRLDIFWTWHLILVVLGLAVVARISRVKASVLTLLYALLALGFSALPVLIFGGMMS